MGKKLILLVENDINLCQSILLILQRANYLVTAASLPAEAIYAVKSGNYHLVIADIDEPGTREVFLPTLINRFTSMPTVILSEMAVTDRERKDVRKNVRYLLKPIAPEDLLNCVVQLLSSRNRASHPNNHNAVLKPW